MNSFAQALISLFKRPVPMPPTSWEALHIFSPSANVDPSLLVNLLLSWAKADPQPTSILCDLRVVSIMHNKMPQPPEHEYLVVTTEDSLKTSRSYILERTVDPSLGTVPGEARVTGVKAGKQLCASVTTSSSGSRFRLIGSCIGRGGFTTNRPANYVNSSSGQHHIGFYGQDERLPSA